MPTPGKGRRTPKGQKKKTSPRRKQQARGKVNLRPIKLSACRDEFGARAVRMDGVSGDPTILHWRPLDYDPSPTPLAGSTWIRRRGAARLPAGTSGAVTQEITVADVATACGLSGEPTSGWYLCLARLWAYKPDGAMHTATFTAKSINSGDAVYQTSVRDFGMGANHVPGVEFIYPPQTRPSFTGGSSSTTSLFKVEFEATGSYVYCEFEVLQEV